MRIDNVRPRVAHPAEPDPAAPPACRDPRAFLRLVASLMTVGLLGTAVIRAEVEGTGPAPLAQPPAVELSPDFNTPFMYRHGTFGKTGQGGITIRAIAAETIDGRNLIRNPVRSPAFLGRYRKALERETERSVDKDPSLQWGVQVDEDGYPLPRVQRMAEKIFDGAHERLLSRMLENLVAEAKPLRAARDYIDGVQLDLLKGGGADFRSGAKERNARRVSASFGLVVSDKPRIEMKTRLVGGIKTRVEIPLGSTGIRTTLSRKLTPRIRGKLGAGIEDSGEDRWFSMGLELKF